MSEQISALMDDEIAVEDAEFLITSIHVNKQASQTWNHYHLIGDAMRAVLSQDKMEESPGSIGQGAR